METLPNELNVRLFLEMDYPTLMNLCQGNRQIYDFCQSEYFWQQKLFRDYPDLVQYKPLEMTYQEHYRSLYYLPDISESIENSRLDQIILHHRNEKELIKENLFISAAKGDIYILDWAFQTLNLVPFPDTYYYAAVNNRYNVLDWLYAHNIEFPEEIQINNFWYEFIGGIIHTMRFSSLPVLLWLEQHGVDLNDWTANDAVYHNQLQLLQWLERNRGYLPDVLGANMAAGNGNLELLTWLYERDIRPNQDGAREAAGEGKLDVLKWMSTFLEPTSEWANMAKGYKHQDILDWLSHKQIYPTR